MIEKLFSSPKKRRLDLLMNCAGISVRYTKKLGVRIQSKNKIILLGQSNLAGPIQFVQFCKNLICVSASWVIAVPNWANNIVCSFNIISWDYGTILAPILGNPGIPGLKFLFDKRKSSTIKLIWITILSLHHIFLQQIPIYVR